ncbi:P-loop containing nucleoside triphosphate hydrolase protein [Penicillium canariense]|uniref:P-loop containing nucleoside triphosphate hydrolase protein n=1 Tax=Penicillium canariense TaxID=189055 RepID=A0A9W9HY01_9EURO|nr:P-loop containing nucleoside triphosphate hydrolase protein [Penicillium canariense]KAJ5160329.1 P-loop containing nucleoside triphosphate hydrolase protein [Penicillium canariense]
MPSEQENQAMHQLQSQQSKLLDKIDELRTIGVGGLVELPQLIVCGNQSSGKSSVLEAISRVRFPTKSTLCTRFATEVILRRKPQKKVKISIEPGDSRTDEQERKKLQSFTSEVFSDGNDLPDLIDQAKAYMGIGDDDPHLAGFSDDVLKVEISGPDKPELTLVDLPGLYYSTSKDQNKEGIRIVRKLTEKYMENKRSVILAVISAKIDYHLQEILNIAKNFDPEYERVLAVVTQPDILEAGSEEEGRYLQYIRNEEVRLKLGWHVLRNRSFETRESTDDKRDEKEKAFFEAGRWASLSRAQVGIDSLRHRLSNVLLKQICRSLPYLITDIQQKIDDHKHELAKLGVERSTPQQQRGFLLNISRNFERIAGQALNGMYEDKFFGGLDDESSDTEGKRRLRAMIRELNEYFADAMYIRGFRRKLPVFEVPELFSHSRNAEFQSYLDCWIPEQVTDAELLEEMMEQASTNRGIELPGSANQLLVGSLFRDQAKPWEDIADWHLTKAWESVKNFVCLVFQYLAGEDTYSSLLGSILMPELEKIQASLRAKLDELISYTKTGHPLPVGRNFLGRIQQSRGQRQLDILKNNLKGFNRDSQKTFTADDLEKAAAHLQSSSDQFAVADIAVQMQAYYDTAILIFIDNVCILAIENCLLRPLEHIFTSQVINDMNDEQIQDIAAEPPYVHEERERLTQELKKLEAGMRTMNVFRTDGSSLAPPSILGNVTTR